jgi:hypothetical protein
MKKMMPDMKMMPEAMEPGVTPHQMVEAMLQGWEDKYGQMPNVETISMDREPIAPRLPAR